jgi:predicted nuclease of restriction endonuclease-like RecB superfamily
MTTEEFNTHLQSMYDVLTTQHFDTLLKTVSDRLKAEPNDVVQSIYETVSKNRELSFKQFKCFTGFTKLIKSDKKSFK